MQLIDIYKNKQLELQKKIEAKELKLDMLPVLQEVNYRIFVFETIQAMCRTAPVTLDKKALLYHFQLISASLRSLIGERKFGPQPNEDLKQKRETSASSLEKVIVDGLERFKGFDPMEPVEYKNKVSKLINAILSVWIQYRNTYVNI